MYTVVPNTNKAVLPLVCGMLPDSSTTWDECAQLLRMRITVSPALRPPLRGRPRRFNQCPVLCARIGSRAQVRQAQPEPVLAVGAARQRLPHRALCAGAARAMGQRMREALRHRVSPPAAEQQSGRAPFSRGSARRPRLTVHRLTRRYESVVGTEQLGADADELSLLSPIERWLAATATEPVALTVRLISPTSGRGCRRYLRGTMQPSTLTRRCGLSRRTTASSPSAAQRRARQCRRTPHLALDPRECRTRTHAARSPAHSSA